MDGEVASERARLHAKYAEAARARDAAAAASVGGAATGQGAAVGATLDDQIAAGATAADEAYRNAPAATGWQVKPCMACDSSGSIKVDYNGRTLTRQCDKCEGEATCKVREGVYSRTSQRARQRALPRRARKSSARGAYARAC